MGFTNIFSVHLQANLNPQQRQLLVTLQQQLYSQQQQQQMKAMQQGARGMGPDGNSMPPPLPPGMNTDMNGMAPRQPGQGPQHQAYIPGKVMPQPQGPWVGGQGNPAQQQHGNMQQNPVSQEKADEHLPKELQNFLTDHWDKSDLSVLRTDDPTSIAEGLLAQFSACVSSEETKTNVTNSSHQSVSTDSSHVPSTLSSQVSGVDSHSNVTTQGKQSDNSSGARNVTIATREYSVKCDIDSNRTGITIQSRIVPKCNLNLSMKSTEILETCTGHGRFLLSNVIKL